VTLKKKRAPQAVPPRSRKAVRGSDEDPSNAFFALLCRSFGDPSVSRSWRSLTDAGVSPRFLEEALTNISVAEILPDMRTGSKSQRKSKWALPSGLTMGQLKRLPAQIRATAERIRKINEHDLYKGFGYPMSVLLYVGSPGSLGNLGALLDAPVIASGSFAVLPDAMNGYASSLEKQIKKVSQLRKGIGRGTEAEFAVKDEVAKLITAVLDVTGEPHWSDLADLLHVVLRKPQGWAQDSEGLRQFYRKRFPAKPL
jgi:hypothetical protein